MDETINRHCVVMQLFGSPLGPTEWDGQYLKDFDFEAGNGLGEITIDRR